HSPMASSGRCVTPTVGSSSRLPRWRASPARRGWSRPVAFTSSTCGGSASERTAASSSGPSRSASSPGSYGAPAAPSTTATSRPLAAAAQARSPTRPRACKLREGQRGLCFVRAREQDAIVLTTYGRSSGFCVDPIEKKPLNHFLPGSAVLSFGTAGCNLACRFCQNWDISKSRELDTLADSAEPELVARAAASLGCASIAFTYNDPV